MSGSCVRLAAEGVVEWKSLAPASLSDERLRKAAQADSKAWFCFSSTRTPSEWLFRTEGPGRFAILVAESGSDAVATFDIRCAPGRVGHFVDAAFEAWTRYNFRVREGDVFTLHESCACEFCTKPAAGRRTVGIRG